jgi:flavodoxin
MEKNTGHWEYFEEIPENTYGFVYKITNLTNNKKYIGKIIETDWKTYTGSSNDLNEDIKKLGKSNFKFEILKICNSKSEMAYYETKIQFENDVLLKEDYYNGIINCRIGKIKL